MHDVWNAAIAELRQKMPGSFDRWFSSVQFDGLTDGVLQLRAQNAFVRDFVSDHYLPTLKEKLRERTGLAIDVAWSIDGELATPVSPRSTERASVPPPPPPSESTASTPPPSIPAPPVERSLPEGLNPKYI